MPMRFYGDAPCRVAVIHGGPGAVGSAGALARGLHERSRLAVAEPLQSADSVPQLVEELHAQLASPEIAAPAVLIGHSWGAWLAALLADRYPADAAGLILVGGGPLRAADAAGIDALRRARLPERRAAEFDALAAAWTDAAPERKNELLRRLGALCDRADTFCPAAPETEPETRCDGAQYERIWSEAAAMRSDGRLAAAFGRLNGPITIVHGDWDPHPADGISGVLKELHVPCTYCLLPRCGHTPWRETYARERFFSLLTRELTAWLPPRTGGSRPERRLTRTV